MYVCMYVCMHVYIYMRCRKGTRLPGFWGQIPPLISVPKSLFFFDLQISPKPHFVLCFVLNPVHFRIRSKNAKNAFCRKSYYLRLDRRGGFWYNRPFFYSSNCCVGLYEAFKAPSPSKPLICSVFCVFSFEVHFYNLLKRPNRKIPFFGGSLIKMSQK